MENNKAMLSTTLLANTPSTSGTTFEATAGEGNRFPTPDFYGVVYPSGVYPTFDNAEIVKVTAVSTDDFTVTRAQLGTSAQDVQSGWRFSHTLITDDFPNLPSSSTDNAIVRFDGTTGRGLQNSSVTVNDSGNLSASGTITGSNLSGTNTGDQDLSSYPTLTSASTLTNKSLVDSSTYIIDDSDNTKKAQFQASGITTATTRTITFPNSSGTMYVTGGTDVSVADGGTGRSTSTTAYGLIAAGTTATGAHQTISPGTSGQFLKSAGSAALASFASINVSDVSGAAASGANSDITSLTGLTTALPLTEGGTGSTTASGARTNLGLGTMATKDGTGFQTLTVASSAPGSPATGDIWVDTSISTGNYSTSEADTGFKWIDGKTIYKKTINGTINFAANTRVVTTVATGISTIDKLIDVQGFYDRGHSTSGQRNYVTFGGGWESSSPGSQTVLFGGYYDSVSQNFIMVTKSDIAGTSKEYSLTLFYTKV